MEWDYKREKRDFEILPEGNYRIRIKSADKAVSKSGNDMLALQFEVSGNNSILYHYIVFMKDKPEITNRMLTSFFDSFSGIPEGDFNTQNWIGKVGACRIKHEDYNGKEQPKIYYFIERDKQDSLPPWQEPPKSARDDGFEGFTEDTSGEELPF